MDGVRRAPRRKRGRERGGEKERGAGRGARSVEGGNIGIGAGLTALVLVFIINNYYTPTQTREKTTLKQRYIKAVQCYDLRQLKTVYGELEDGTYTNGLLDHGTRDRT